MTRVVKPGDFARITALPFRGQVGQVVEVDGSVTMLRLDSGLVLGFLKQSIEPVVDENLA